MLIEQNKTLIGIKHSLIRQFEKREISQEEFDKKHNSIDAEIKYNVKNILKKVYKNLLNTNNYLDKNPKEQLQMLKDDVVQVLKSTEITNKDLRKIALMIYKENK